MNSDSKHESVIHAFNNTCADIQPRLHTVFFTSPSSIASAHKLWDRSRLGNSFMAERYKSDLRLPVELDSDSVINSTTILSTIMNTFTIVNEPQHLISDLSVASKSAQILEMSDADKRSSSSESDAQNERAWQESGEQELGHDQEQTKTKGGKKKKKKKKKKTDKVDKKTSAEGKKKKKKYTKKSRSNADTNIENVDEATTKTLSELIDYYDNPGTKNLGANDEKTEETFGNHSSLVSSFRNASVTNGATRLPRRVSFGASGALSCGDNDANRVEEYLTVDFGGEHRSKRSRSARSLHTGDVQEYSKSPSYPGRRRNFRSPKSPAKRISSLASSFISRISMPDFDRRDQSIGYRTAFGKSRNDEQNKNFRITKNLTQMRAERIEAYFFNHGMEIALGVLYVAINLLVAAQAAFQFTELGGWTTDDDILRWTLPIARAGGRLVTLNCALLLLTGCKYLWTCIRTYVMPILPIGFPIDNIMPKYHRYVALTVIVSGCIIHTLPQIVNYATRSISMDEDGMRVWTFGDGFATKQLLITGTLLTIIFSTFFVTTLKCFRKTGTGFRWFWFFHMGGIATAYPLLLIHGTCRGHPVFLYFALGPLVLYLFDIAMRRYNISTTDVLEFIIHEDEGQQITELIIKSPMNFDYTPGQYVELKFPTISNSEWHPFTIASAPSEEGDDEAEKKLVFYIKNSGRWTEALYEYASSFNLSKPNKSTQIHIRGPHGAPAMNYFEYKHIVVIGSGVGATPLLSIWKYLVAKSQNMIYNRDATARESIFSRDCMVSRFIEDNELPDDENMRESIRKITDYDGEKSSSKMRPTCVYLSKIFESMTVSMFLLALFILGETATFVLHMFGYGVTANNVGWALSLIVLAAHGTTVFVSSVSLGPFTYFKTFKCWLECGIITADIVATFALSVSIKKREDLVGAAFEMNIGANNIFFVFFGLVVALHAIRIFHIFYTALKPPSQDTDSDDEDSLELIGKSLTYSHHSRASSRESIFDMQEICSIEGILINRMYSNMRFAARSLLKPVLEKEEGLDDLFSLEFYGTREKPELRDCSEKGLITGMMGSQAYGLDIRSAIDKNPHEQYFHSGRPDWNTVFLKAIAKAHQRNPDGGSVGVFFCGSPAIAKDLQVAAAEVTARHQFATKHLDGKACKCKLIVHSENF